MSVELIIGAVSLATLLNTVESCVRGYDTFVTSTRAANFNGESGQFALDLHIEQRKFDLYWKYVDLSQTDCPVLRVQSVATQRLVVDVTNEICRLLTDSNKLARDYGFEVGPEADLVVPQTLANFTVWSIIDSVRQYRSGMAMGNTSAQSAASTASAAKRVRWVWKDQAKAMQFIDQLRKYNADLYALLSPHHEFLLKLGEPSFFLPGFNDSKFLRALTKRTSAMPSDGPLQSASELRGCLVDFENGVQDPNVLSNTTLFANEVWIQHRSDPKAIRDIGSFQGQQVIIEYKNINPNLTEAQHLEVRERLKQLIQLLSRKYHSTFRFLRAIGMFEDPRDSNRYGLVFRRFEESPPPGDLALHSLSSLLEDPSIRFNLGARFKLAQALCIAIMHLHAAGWLHKSITPNNIIFTTAGTAYPDITEPRLIGFELTRPDRPLEHSLDVQPVGDAPNHFIHPERQSTTPPARYRKQHDYYALGMCLLCIGAWQPLAKLERPYKAKYPENERSPSKWADFAQDYVGGVLGHLCGEIYRDVVLVCLNGKFPLPAGASDEDSDSNLQTAFYSVVVKKLAECHA